MAFARKRIVPIPLYSESDAGNSGKQCTFASRRVDDRRWMMFERPIRVRAGPVSRFVITRAARLERAVKLDEENLPETGDIVSVCAGLVTVDEESDIIRLIRTTVTTVKECQGK
jgi:hypothetical protein